ncbi:hypothetical protein RN001_006687 [Aquatica leii]|uniref:Transposase domain-containing protein n=1 Tax=Aquatica leii TaxID=1421715 RepID=A0AAN7QL66_9COLE|nr:hypothetical protein RN001_006687 [Aquatica leii]
MPKTKLYNKPNRQVYRHAALHTECDVFVSTESLNQTVVSNHNTNKQANCVANENVIDNHYFDNIDADSNFDTDVESNCSIDEIDSNCAESFNDHLNFSRSVNNVLKESKNVTDEINYGLDPCQLAEWAVNTNLPHVHLNSLLRLLKPFHKNLPLDARTLLKSPRQLQLKNVEPDGQYYHFGVRNAVLKLISSYHVELESLIEITLNVDGLPISKSNGSQFYPILCNLFCNPNYVQIIGLYHGKAKPKYANDLLEDFVNEVVSLTINGFQYNNKTYELKIKGFICDAPAKSFIVYTKGHTGYHSCSKCFIEGEYSSDKISFPDTENLRKRDNNNFRSKVDINYHTGTSIIKQIPGFDMVSGIPLDYMHLICLGVMRKLLLQWVTGKPPIKLSFRSINAVSENLEIQAKNIPCELIRKPQLRQFLIYTGPLVLKSILPYDVYLNFLSLHVATTILSSSKHIISLGLYAHELLKYFVETFIVLYGRHNVSHNVHNLLHIYDDTLLFGVLHNFSAFPFENFLNSIKNLVRKGDKPLSQVIKRLSEINYCNNITQQGFSDSNEPQAINEHCSGPIPEDSKCWLQYRKLRFKDFTLKLTEADNCCCLVNKTIVLIKNIVSNSQKEFFIMGNAFQKTDNLYNEPCDSSQLGIQVASNLRPLTTWSIDKIAFKYFKLRMDSETSVVFPLLHTERQF